MGYSTELFTNISFNREAFNSLDEVDSRIDEINSVIKIYEDELKAAVLITEPKKFCEEDEDPLRYLQCKIDTALEELKGLYIDRYKLELLIDSWNYSHNEEGYAIPRPDNIKWNTAFLDGDFIKHSKDD